MKTLFIILTFPALFVFSNTEAQAGKGKSLATDPSYSVHNYKHPIKALKAKQWATDNAPTQLVVIKEVIPSLADSRRNYKKHQRSKAISSYQESKPVKNSSADHTNANTTPALQE